MIALLTDFHTSDGIGQAKGVMKTIHPATEIMDFSNFVEPFKVRSGAWILLTGYNYFPKGTVFYCVVDPGVGSKRKAIAIQTRNYFFVGPDNGLMYPAASEDGIVEAVELPVHETASKTFHGRDVFSPAAAKLDKGDIIGTLGKKLAQLKQLDLGSSNGSGEVVLIEHYGNVVTNIPPTGKESYDASCGNFKKNLKFHATYEEASDGELFAIKGSRNTLEISVKTGSAASAIKCSVGDAITIR